jgi:hypothetical protein
VKIKTVVIVIPASLLALAAALVVGMMRQEVAESAASCMQEAHDLRICSRPGGDGLWGSVVLFAILGAGAGAFGYSASQKREAG